MLTSIAFEAKYFQVTELESMALISLNAGGGNLHATVAIPLDSMVHEY